MTWEEIANFGALVGGLGVIATLLYLAAQVRQNTRALRAGIGQAVAGSAPDLLLRWAQDRATLEVIVKATEVPAELDPVERMQLRLLWRSTFRSFENQFYQHDAGTLPEEVWEGYRRTIRDTATSGAVGEWWEANKATFGARFRAFIDAERGSQAGEPDLRFLGGTGGRS